MANLQRDVFLRSDIKNSLEAIKHANAAALSRLRSEVNLRDSIFACLCDRGIIFTLLVAH